MLVVVRTLVAECNFAPTYDWINNTLDHDDTKRRCVKGHISEQELISISQNPMGSSTGRWRCPTQPLLVVRLAQGVEELGAGEIQHHQP
jgi:hypothetical protein